MAEVWVCARCADTLKGNPTFCPKCGSTSGFLEDRGDRSVVVKNLRLVHHRARRPGSHVDTCNQDKQIWPCDIRILLDEIDKMRHLAEITAAPVMGEVAL